MLEFVVKAVSMGLVFEKGTYLRDPWNMIDFAVVITGIIGFFPGYVNLSSVRGFRIMRPLKSIKAIPNMKILISTIFKSLPSLINAFAFLIFIIVLFAILGLQLFMGLLGNRCRLSQFPVNGQWLINRELNYVCNLDTNSCPVGNWCGNSLQYNLNIDYRDEFLNFGFTNFDNIFYSMLTVFLVIQTEDWSKILFLFQNAYTPAVIQIYFNIVIFFGYFFTLNIILAMLCEAFFFSNKEKNLEKIRQIKMIQIKESKESLENQEQLNQLEKDHEFDVQV